MKRRITIEDVALAAGVSRQTVSRAINSKGEISPDTLQRVMHAVEVLGYRPSGVARGLATRHTRTIGLVVPDITNPFFPEVARGVQDIARSQDYSVFLCNTDESPQEELQALNSLAAQPVDGIILCGSRINEDDLGAFADRYRPLVMLNRSLQRPGVSSILVDNHHGARLVVNYLADHGHTAIGMLAGPVTSPSSTQRVEGFCQAMAARNLPTFEDSILFGPPTIEGGHEAARLLLTRHPQVTALFAYNDLSALGSIQACRDLGRLVPAECAIIGFDDVRLAAMVSPALTSVHVDKYYLGQQAMLRLLAMFDEPEAAFPPVQVDVQLVVRESALPPRSEIKVRTMDLNQLTKMYDFTGKSVVITGGAGILGGEIACALVGCGASVAIMDRDPSLAERLMHRLETSIGQAIVIYGDVLDTKVLNESAQQVIDAFGRIDCLINAAGGNNPRATTGPDRPFFDLPPDALRFVFDLNVIGTILASQVFGKYMTERGEGVILNVSSMNAFRPLTKIPAYSAAKAAVTNFTQWLAVHMAQEYSPRIRVNAIAPGFFLTMQNKFLLVDEASGELTPRGKTIIDHTPMGRFGEPEDLLATVLWLLSPASAFVTGVVVPIDGGFSAYSGV